MYEGVTYRGRNIDGLERWSIKDNCLGEQTIALPVHQGFDSFPAIYHFYLSKKRNPIPHLVRYLKGLNYGASYLNLKTWYANYDPSFDFEGCWRSIQQYKKLKNEI